ncbi:LAGLIDADG family homing endonuclease [Streptomyces sp. NPDC127108]|uniref:LAGLIDADG family homing endonuclease n=1 Tax=Streptomyces sp. NPDC127108 TaxID=3345361 RepID=UPI00363CFBEF
MEISACDSAILYEFQRLTPYNSTISERTRSTNFAETHTSAIWNLHSLEARTTVNRLGLPYGRKSKVVGPPSVAFSQRDYVRGIVDADGSIGYTGQGLPFVSLTTASTAVARYFSQHAHALTGAERTLTRNARDGVYNVLYVTETAQALAADLYYPDCLALERKQSSATSVLSWTRPAGSKVKPPRIRWTPEMDRRLLAAPTIKHAASELGYSLSACQVRRWKLRNGLVQQPD